MNGNQQTARTIRLATPATYEGGVISIRPGQRALRPDELADLAAEGYEVIEERLVGWGQHRSVIRAASGRSYLVAWRRP